MRTNEQFGDLKGTLQTIIDELASLRTDMLTHWQWHQERGDT